MTVQGREQEDDWKESLKERYNRMADTDWFKRAHEGRSIGDSIPIAK